MNKKLVGALAAPLTILALSLSACGGGSTPAASSSGAAAPSSSAGPATPPTTASAPASTEAISSTTAVTGDDTLGDADVDAAAKVFKAKWPGSTVIGSESGAYKFMAIAPALLEKADIKPAECKTLAIKSFKALPEDSKLAVVTNDKGASTPGAVLAISFMSLKDDTYFTVSSEVAKEQVAKCKTMTMEMAGQKTETSTETFEAAGVNADLATGVISTQKVAGTTTTTVSITASRGSVGVTVQAASDSEESRANLVKAVNEGFEALGAK